MSHKLQIELSCVESSLLEALYEVKELMKVSSSTVMQLKVFPAATSPHDGHRWITVRKESDPQDLVKIYELEGKLRLFKL